MKPKKKLVIIGNLIYYEDNCPRARDELLWVYNLQFKAENQCS